MTKPSWLEWRSTWTVWAFGVAADLELKQAGICFGPWALWICW